MMKFIKEQMMISRINKFLNYNGIVIGLILLIFIIIVALVGPWVCRYSPKETDYSSQFAPPSFEKHIFGTDDFGRDVFSRCLYGARLSLYIGSVCTLLIIILGTTLGIAAAFSSLFDAIIMRFMEVMMAIPAMLLAMLIMAIFGYGANKVIIAVTIVYIPQVARLVRGETLSIKKEEYVEASYAQGASILHIIYYHILPNLISVLLVQATFSFAYAILTESALDFLGLGIPATEVSLGLLISEGREFITFAPWLSLFPGLIIMLIVLSSNFLGDGLRDYSDINLNINFKGVNN